MRWLDGIADWMDMNMGKLREVVKDGDAWRAAVHGVAKSRTWLSDWTTTMATLYLTFWGAAKLTAEVWLWNRRPQSTWASVPSLIPYRAFSLWPCPRTSFVTQDKGREWNWLRRYILLIFHRPPPCCFQKLSGDKSSRTKARVLCFLPLWRWPACSNWLDLVSLSRQKICQWDHYSPSECSFLPKIYEHGWESIETQERLQLWSSIHSAVLAEQVLCSYVPVTFIEHKRWYST